MFGLMKFILQVSSILFIIICTIPVAASQIQIQQLDDTNFEQIINNNEFVLIEFYSLNCQYCKIFQPEYVIAANTLIATKTPVLICKINQPYNVQLAKSQNVQGLPTIMLYDNGYPMQYLGQRDGIALAEWVVNYLKMRIKTVQKQQQIQKGEDYFGITSQNQGILAIINKAAFFVPDYNFYHIRSDQRNNSTDFLLKFVNRDNSVFQYSRSGQKMLTTKDMNNLIQWMKSMTSTPIKLLLDDQAINQVMLSQERSGLILVYGSDKASQQDTDSDKKTDKIYSLIVNYCERNKNRLACGKILPSYPIYQGSHDFFRQKTKKTLLGIVKQHMRIAYVFSGNYEQLTESSLKQFIEDAINDQIPRTVDDTAPSAIQYDSVQLLNPDTFQQYANKHNITLVQFYWSGDETCRYFASRYQSLSTILGNEQQTQHVGVGAIDCSKNQDYCQQKLIQYYPTIRLYIFGLSVQFEKSQKLPQIPDIVKFITDRLQRRPTQIKDLSELSQQPAVVISVYQNVGQEQLLEQIGVFAKIFVKMPVYIIRNSQLQQQIQNGQDLQQSFKLQIHLDGENIVYSGNTVNFQIRKVQKWINSQTGPLLSDLMRQMPDDKILSAIQNRKPIIFLIDAQKEKSSQIRTKFGNICKKLGLPGAYAESTHPGFNSLLEWIQLKRTDIRHSLIIYSETVTDYKFLYPYPASEITKQTFEQFVNDIKEGKFLDIGSSKINEPKQEDKHNVEVTDL